MKMLVRVGLVVFIVLVGNACAQRASEQIPSTVAENLPSAQSAESTHAISYSEQRQPCSNYQVNRQALFGDLHVHSSLSFDAVAGRLDTRPAAAHDFARGKSIPFFPQDEDGQALGTKTIDRPLDFLAVTDHSEYLGERALCTNPESPAYEQEFCSTYREVEFRGTLMMASVVSQEIPERIAMLCGEGSSLCLEYAKAPWQEIIEAAEAAYDRSEDCAFTSFVGYEYTGTPNNTNYHRNVIFRNSSVPDLPVSYIEAPKDYQLWKALDEVCLTAKQCDYMTIPHNSNLSNGLLLTPYADLELTDSSKIAYAQSRLAREPLMEIFQHKGGSECINGLANVHGDVDELCDFEQVRHFGEESTGRSFHLDGAKLVFAEPDVVTATECKDGEKSRRGLFAAGCISGNDFLRTALLTGMEEQQSIGFNPVKLGVIASTDGHTATPGAVAESDWSGTVSGEMDRAGRLSTGTLPSGIKGNPGGLAGVWSEENSRDAIFNALERKETFGTSGPRISPRFFAGWDYSDDLCDQVDMISLAYAGGVPMGGDLSAHENRDHKPSFLLAANRDPGDGATPLQRLQLVKGWLDSQGKRHTRVQTVAGSKNTSGVDLRTGKPHGSGHNRLCAVVRDVDFDPDQASYYYLRVVENPSARWSLYDCLSIDEAERPEICANLSDHIIQEMAWSSPVWYVPKN